MKCYNIKYGMLPVGCVPFRHCVEKYLILFKFENSDFAFENPDYDSTVKNPKSGLQSPFVIMNFWLTLSLIRTYK